MNVRFVDFHAEVTSEKLAMGWYLDGRVSAVVGTHTHVPTADTRILPNGTAYQTDAGMTGPYQSVIGVDKDIILQRFLTQMPVRMEAARHGGELHGVIVEVDEASGHATSIRRIASKLSKTWHSASNKRGRACCAKWARRGASPDRTDSIARSGGARSGRRDYRRSRLSSVSALGSRRICRSRGGCSRRTDV